MTRTRFTAAMTLALGVVLLSSMTAGANVALLRLSTDTFTNTTSFHRTEVEPDTLAFGPTEVSAFQVGRFADGGSSDIGFATSTDSGVSWTNGVLPGITTFVGGSFDRVSDPAVAFDLRHNTWLISSLALRGTDGAAVLVNRSADGRTWSGPVTVSAPPSGGLDKSWAVCDNTVTSPFFGNCYAEWDDNGAGNLILMSTSTDGGLSWSAPAATANRATGLGGQPLVQPSGTVVVPIDNANESAVLAFVSTDGGLHWNATVRVSTISSHRPGGNLRSDPLVSAEIDLSGTIYVVWNDCRFENRCRANDIVMSTSSNGTAWSPVARVPIDPIGSGVDHFIPGLGVDPTSTGTTAHLGLTYYFYPVANCTRATCQLDVGFISSVNGGSTWSSRTQLAGPMLVTSLPKTTQGFMVGDYISTSFAAGTAHPVFAVAGPKMASTFDEAMFTPVNGLLRVRGGPVAADPGEHAVPGAVSDHAAPQVAVTSR